MTNDLLNTESLHHFGRKLIGAVGFLSFTPLFND